MDAGEINELLIGARAGAKGGPCPPNRYACMLGPPN